MSARKLSRREMLKLSGAFAASAVLAACAQPAPAPAPAAPAAKAEPTKAPEAPKAEPTKAAAPAAAGGQKVELWTGFGQGRMADAMTGAVKRFNEKQQKFAVEHVIVPWGEIRNKVVAATAAGNPPDVYRGWNWIVGDDAPIGGLTDLTPYVNATADFKPEDIWPGTLEQMKYQGKIYGLSISTMVQLLYFNKDRMKEKGFDTEKLPADIEGWEEMGHKLYELSGKKIDRVGFCPFIPGIQIWLWGATRNISVWDANAGKCTANNPAMVDLFKWYKSYATKYGTEELQAFMTTYSGNNYGRNTPEGVYYTGKLSIWALATWLYNDMKEYGPKVNFGVTKVPSPKGVAGKPGHAQANLYLVPKGCKNPEGGFQFGHFMSSDPWVALNKAVPDSVTPSRKSLASDPEVEKAAPWIKVARDEVMPTAWAVPSMPSVGFYERQLNDALGRVLWENADPAKEVALAVEAAQREVDKKLKK